MIVEENPEVEPLPEGFRNPRLQKGKIFVSAREGKTERRFRIPKFRDLDS